MTIRICNSCSRYPQCSSKCGAKICDGSCKGGPGPNSLLVYLRTCNISIHNYIGLPHILREYSSKQRPGGHLAKQR